MRRPWQVALVFGVGLAILLAAMGWVTASVLRLQDETAAARRVAVEEEAARLALWRIDSAVSTIVGRESVRPYFEWVAFHPADRAYPRMFAEADAKPGDVLLPSPLLAATPPHIKLHFQVGPDGTVTSPQVPQAPSRKPRARVPPGYVPSDAVREADGRLAELTTLLDIDGLRAAVPSHEHVEPQAPTVAIAPAARSRDSIPMQQVLTSNEDNARIANQLLSNPPAAQGSLGRLGNYWQAPPRRFDTVVQADEVEGLPVTNGRFSAGMMHALWHGGELLLVRRVVLDDERWLQGVWLDWRSLEGELLGRVADLLPNAGLGRATAEGAPDGRTLAGLPVKLEPGPLDAEENGGALTPLDVSLLVAWGAALLAVLAVGFLLRGVVVLSERRGTFVSAVTHELRTPLTTFRMYAEMLAGGMVRSEEKRTRYLTTLQAEADRLGHLVENVLAYARIERNRAAGTPEDVRVGDLVERVADAIARRLSQSHRELCLELDADAADATVRVDRAAMERVLFNLADNAAKYASDAADPRVHLQATLADDVVQLRVRDHGPGVAPDARRRLFRAFAKSATAAAHSKPGVGLGLALGRKLARRMGGDLLLDETHQDGAAFVLILPLPDTDSARHA